MVKRGNLTHRHQHRLNPMARAWYHRSSEVNTVAGTASGTLTTFSRLNSIS